MRAIAGSILILAAVLFHRSPTTSRPIGFCLLWLIVLSQASHLRLECQPRPALFRRAGAQSPAKANVSSADDAPNDWNTDL